MANFTNGNAQEFHFKIPKTSQQSILEFRQQRQQAADDQRRYNADPAPKQRMNSDVAAEQLGLSNKLQGGNLGWDAWGAVQSLSAIRSGALSEEEYAARYGISSAEGAQIEALMYG